MVVIYSRDGIKLYSLLFTACLKNDFGESIYVFSVCVTLTAKFSIPIERLSRTEWSCLLYDQQRTMEISIVAFSAIA